MRRITADFEISHYEGPRSEGSQGAPICGALTEYAWTLTHKLPSWVVPEALTLCKKCVAIRAYPDRQYPDREDLGEDFYRRMMEEAPVPPGNAGWIPRA